MFVCFLLVCFFLSVFFIYFVYSFIYLFYNIKSGDGGHRSHCPFHAKEMLYHLCYIPSQLVWCDYVSWYNRTVFLVFVWLFCFIFFILFFLFFLFFFFFLLLFCLFIWLLLLCCVIYSMAIRNNEHGLFIPLLSLLMLLLSLFTIGASSSSIV